MKGDLMTLQERPVRAEEHIREGVPQPGPAFPFAPSPTGQRPRLLLAALATAVLLWMCHFPLGWGWLAWAALVPLLCLVRAGASAWRVWWAAWAGGTAFFWPALNWMRTADLAPGQYAMTGAWAMLATYCSLYFPVAVLLVRRLDRSTRLPLIVTLPVVWTALEFVRSFLLTGFSWYYLAHTQHRFLALIQISDLAGAYAVSFLVAAGNAWLFEVLFRQEWFRRWFRLPQGDASSVRSLALQGAALACLLGAALGYGCWRLGQDDFAEGPRVVLLQPNLDQRIRNAASLGRDPRDAKRTMIQETGLLCKLAKQQKADLVVWPETSFPDHWLDVSPELAPDRVPRVRYEGVRKEVREVAAYCKAAQLLGLVRILRTGQNTEQKYNSAMLVGADGKELGRYDKIHRVPFGEYVPFRDSMPFLQALTPYEGEDYSVRPGEHLTRLQLGNHRFGVVICNEDTDPFLARGYGRDDEDGPAVDFLLNISNEGWFNGNREHNEHLAICRFRAIECRRAVARSVNMGISAVIDSNGRVLRPTSVATEKDPHSWQIPAGGQASELPVDDWSDFKQVSGVLTASIPIDDRLSLYAVWGDWLPGVCWLVVAGALLWSWRPRRNPFVKSPEVNGAAGA
jgi:apolipoprotein N-acyltransferase